MFRPRNSRHWILAAALFAICGLPSVNTADAQTGLGTLEYEVKSKYSHIRVRKQGSRRMLNFVRSGGKEVIETIVDLEKPHHLLAPYTQTMFASLLIRPDQKRMLLVGLGGGAMVLFLQKHFPKTKADVVEIDPEVVKIADKYFGAKGNDNIAIHTQDAFDFLKKSKTRYDAIYMDAFLKPSRGTDATGAPLRLKTYRFLKSLHAKLADDGVVVFNLNTHRGLRRDLATIRRAFPQTYTFKVGGTGGLVVVASLNRKLVTARVMQQRAAALDAKLNANFTFQTLAKTRIR